MLEWQLRSSTQLLQGPTLDEQAQSSVTARNGSSHILRPSLRSSILAKSELQEGSQHTFNSSESRQTRLLETYLSERRYIIKTSQYIVSEAQCQTSREHSGRATGKPADRVSWVQEIGNALLVDYQVDGVSPKFGKNIIVSVVDALQKRATGLEQGSGWFKDQGLREDIEAAWAINQILEMIHIMETILVLLDSSAKLTRSDAFLSWFRFTSSYGFFELFEPVSLGENIARTAADVA